MSVRKTPNDPSVSVLGVQGPDKEDVLRSLREPGSSTKATSRKWTAECQPPDPDQRLV